MLWLRCIFALGLIVVLTVAGNVLLSQRIDAQRADSVVINVSGRQRMLSQRISVMALRYATAKDDASRRELADAIALMERAHLALTRGDAEMGIPPSRPEALEEHYFGEDVALDRAVVAYLTDAKELLDVPVAQLDAANPKVASLLEASKDELLTKLHDAVGLYERDASEKVHELERIDLALTLAMLLLVIVIALFVLRPMIEEVVESIERAKRDGESIAKKEYELRESQEKVEAEALARRMAEESSRAKSKFLANVSHELRTPLNAILGYSELLLEELDTEQDAARKDVERIHVSGSHLLSLIDDVLDISAIESGELSVECETFTLDELVEQVASKTKSAFDKTTNGLTLEVSSGDFELFNDRRRIVQILLNLLSNSAKFTSSGEVVLRAWIEGDDVVFEVADDGIGMDEQTQQRIFEAFVQADSSTTRAYGGVGVGLALCAHITRTLDGSIEVESVEGKGSTFRVSVPHHVDRGGGPDDTLY